MSEFLRKNFAIVATTTCISGVMLILLKNEIGYVLYGYDIDLLKHFSEQTSKGKQATEAWWETAPLRASLQDIGGFFIGLAFIFVVACAYVREKLNISARKIMKVLTIVTAIPIVGYFAPIIYIVLNANYT